MLCKVPDKKELQVIEKPSTRPVSFDECCRIVKKLKNEYGHNLKQLLIWNVDEIVKVVGKLRWYEGLSREQRDEVFGYTLGYFRCNRHWDCCE